MSLKTSTFEKQAGQSQVKSPASMKTTYFSAKQLLPIPTASAQEQGMLAKLEGSIKTMESGATSVVKVKLSEGNDPYISVMQD